MELALIILHPKPSEPVGPVELPPAILHLVEGVERSLASANSRRAYRTSLLGFFSWCGSEGPVPFSRLTVLRYKDALIALTRETRETPLRASRRLSTATVNLRLAAVRALAQEAADQGLLDQAEAAAIRRVRGERVAGTRMGMWISKEELDRILLTADRTTIRGQRDYALLAVLFSTGIRRRELVELSVATIQQRDGQWGLIDLRGKGQKVRSVSLPLWVKDAVFAWLNATGIVQGPLFRSISRHGRLSSTNLSDESVKLLLTKYALPHDLGNFRPHDARRTCARLCRAADASLEDIQEMLGHASIQTTERYLGRTAGFKRAITNAISAPKNL
jgi:integrase/recombinase XerD